MVDFMCVCFFYFLHYFICVFVVKKKKSLLFIFIVSVAQLAKRVSVIINKYALV